MSSREKLLIDRGWKLHIGDIPYIPTTDFYITYMLSKSEHTKGPQARDYDDRSWKDVDLPYDHVLEEVPDQKESGSHGGLARKNAWYRRTFKLSEEDRGKRLSLLFDGVAVEATVYINGQLVARNYTAGTSFEADFTDYARYGEDVNVVSVYSNIHDFEGWYYEGGGIYRHVWLCKSDPLSVDLWGTYITTDVVSGNTWKCNIETTVRNIHDCDKTYTVLSEILDGKGNVIGSGSIEATAAYYDTGVSKQEVLVENPPVWSLEEPNLCTLRTTVICEDEVKDVYLTTFGFRTIAFDPELGFLLNGKRVKIKGTSNHMDYSGQGVALPDTLQYFRIKRLKEMGSNGYRCAHNPHAPEVYQACDEIGMLVMDENRWMGSTKEIQEQLTSMIKRDRNHPSIVMWSMWNEEPAIRTYIGQQIMRTMAAVTHKLDPTRPVTAALYLGGSYSEGGVLRGQYFDVYGMNYAISLLEKGRQQAPGKGFIGTENGQGMNPNGIGTWRKCAENDWISGIFPWTGWQYRGESDWPNTFSRSGSYNQIGYPTSGALYYKTQWLDAPACFFATHWNGYAPGEVVKMEITTNGDAVELFLNGKSLGTQVKEDKYAIVTFEIPYEPGELVANVTKDGKPFVTARQKTTGPAVAIKLTLDNYDPLNANGEDVAIVTAHAIDAEGNLVPDYNDSRVTFAVNDLGVIRSVGSADPADHDPWYADNRMLFAGRCQVIVQANYTPGTMVVTASDPVLGEAKLEVALGDAPARPHVQEEDNHYLYIWSYSPVMTEKPDLMEMIKNSDPSQWKTIEAGRGSLIPFAGYLPRRVNEIFPESVGPDRAWMLWHNCSVTPRNTCGKAELGLYFDCVEGAADFVVISKTTGKTAYARKDNYNMTPFEFSLGEIGEGEEVDVWCLLEADSAFDAIDMPVHFMYR